MPADLRPVGGPRKGKAFENAIQEIDVATGELLFEWRSLDHVGIGESYRRAREGQPYDYLHANSVDVGPDGSLLLSARHTWALYAIDRRSGEVRWRLGGTRSDFELGPDVRFAWQHDARWQGEGAISLFDNGAEPKVEDHSSGLVLDVDQQAMRVTLARAFTHPRRPLAIAMGSMQPLPNGGACVGWGTVPQTTVFGADGKPRLDAQLPKGGDLLPRVRPAVGREAGRDARARRRPGATARRSSTRAGTARPRWRAGGFGAARAPTRCSRRATVERTGFETAIQARLARPLGRARRARRRRPRRSAPRARSRSRLPRLSRSRAVSRASSSCELQSRSTSVRSTSRIPTIPSTLPSWITGRWRIRFSCMSRAAPSTSSSGWSVKRFVVITSPTRKSPNAAPSPASRSTSRSVKMPTRRPSSQIATEPVSDSSIRAIATCTLSSGRTVTSAAAMASTTDTLLVYQTARHVVEYHGPARSR